MTDLLSTPPPTDTPAPPVTQPAATPPANTSPPVTSDPPSLPTLSNDLPENWHLALGDAYAAETPTLSRFKTLEDLTKSFLHFRKTGPAYPEEGGNHTEEDIARFRTIAKVPATAAEYGLQKPADLPEGVIWDDQFVNTIAEVAHKHHVPAPALQALVAEHTKLELARAQQHATEQQAAQQKQQAELYQHLGKGDQFLVAAGNVNHLIKVFAEKANLNPEDPGLAAIKSNPAMIRILHEISKMTREDGIRPPNGLGDIRTSKQRAYDIMQGRDTDLSPKYNQGDPKTVALVQTLLSSKS